MEERTIEIDADIKKLKSRLVNSSDIRARMAYRRLISVLKQQQVREGVK